MKQSHVSKKNSCSGPRKNLQPNSDSAWATTFSSTALESDFDLSPCAFRISPMKKPSFSSLNSTTRKLSRMGRSNRSLSSTEAIPAIELPSKPIPLLITESMFAGLTGKLRFLPLRSVKKIFVESTFLSFSLICFRLAIVFAFSFRYKDLIVVEIVKITKYTKKPAASR